MNDIWETYSVNFSIYYPLSDENECMRIMGEEKEAGKWAQELGPQKMTESINEVEWLTGEKVRPWEWSIEFG